MLLPKAVLWDMDGTLADTEPYWIAAERELVQQHAGTWTHEDALSCVGQPLLASATKLRDRGGVALEPKAIVDILVASVVRRMVERVVWRPGAVRLLGELADAAVPCALVTSSYRSLADVLVKALPAGTFGAVVCGDEVSRPKPHPEPYLRAAARLGVDARRCVAIEDSAAGLASAHAAGCRVLGIPNLVPVEMAPGRSRLPSLEAVDLAVLGRLSRGVVVDDVDGTDR